MIRVTGPVNATTAAPSSGTTKPGDPAPPAKRRGRPPKAGPKAPPKPKTTRPGAGLAGSPEAKRKASVILEVLGGLRSPPCAAAVLGVSVQRYYLLEVRALQGLVAALDVTPKRGGAPSPETALRRLAAERDRLARELLRAQALVRVAQRAVGLPPPVQPAPAKASATKGKAGKAAKRRTRTPTVRARRAADELRAAATTEADARDAPPVTMTATPATVTTTS